MVLWEKSLSEFPSNHYVLRPRESEKTVFTKFYKIGAFFVCLKKTMEKSKTLILVSDGADKSSLIIFITFFD